MENVNVIIGGKVTKIKRKFFETMEPMAEMKYKIKIHKKQHYLIHETDPSFVAAGNETCTESGKWLARNNYVVPYQSNKFGLLWKLNEEGIEIYKKIKNLFSSG